MIVSQPFEKAHKTGIHQQNICCNRSILFFKFKCGLLILICKHAPGMMFPFTFLIVQNKNRFFRRSLRITGSKCLISADYFLFLFSRCLIKIKYWHISFSPYHWYIFNVKSYIYNFLIKIFYREYSSFKCVLLACAHYIMNKNSS